MVPRAPPGVVPREALDISGCGPKLTKNTITNKIPQIGVATIKTYNSFSRNSQEMPQIEIQTI